MKLTYWRTVQYVPAASEDPVELYCNLPLWHELLCVE